MKNNTLKRKINQQTEKSNESVILKFKILLVSQWNLNNIVLLVFSLNFSYMKDLWNLFVNVITELS